MSRRALAVVLSMSLGLVPPAVSAGGTPVGTPKERKLHELVNRARDDEGRKPLRLWRKLTRRAHRHSRHMAREQRVFHHGCVSCAMPDGWDHYGENVVAARGIRRAHNKLMRSAEHRDNILCRCFTRVGIGVVKRHGWVWVTEMFWG